MVGLRVDRTTCQTCACSVVVRAVVRRSGEQGFGSRSVRSSCKYYAAYPYDRCTCLTNTHLKVARMAQCFERQILFPIAGSTPLEAQS
ncbi:hypothetical protein Y032_0223g2686 [Ancylostoma ceylanicum]|uniref:Uncharacterized protein n=1 Tax=Ancylostoma ceylanicum TaxID=53326 RepID=A0A016SHJ9_9BILA|nr:hypothetical protein Y032_0223g2686 [Ancylostoma ceylanicum]